MTRNIRFLGAVLATLVATSGMFGCDKVADAIGKKAKEKAAEEVAKAIEGGGVASTGGPNLFADASSIPTKFQEKVNPARALELLVYPDWSKTQLQDPNKKLNVDEFTYRGGTVSDGAPVKFIGKQPTEADIQRQSFDLTTIDFTQVPKMVADAPVQLKYEDAKVTHMILKHNMQGKLHWRVYVNSPRRSGSVEYDTKGAKQKVWE
mgnify:CR=1 FL=1